MEIVKKHKDVSISFTGTTDLMNYVDTHGRKKGKSRSIRSDSFCPYTWDSTINSFTHGWKGSESIKVNADRISNMGPHTGYGTEYAVTGDFIDVGAFLSGVPECWGSVIEEPKAMKKARILIDGATHGGMEAENIENRGSAIIALIDSLRNSGHYLEVTIMDTAKGVGPKDLNISTSITFETNNSYSRDVLAFSVAHPGMLRRLIFAVMEAYTKKDDLDGYGSCGTLNPDGYDIFIKPTHQGNWRTIDQAKKNIETIIEDYERGH